MKCYIVGILVLQLLRQCGSRGLPEESVVSVYHGPSAGDVYHQIANNIAERVTSPIYSFFGFGVNKTESATEKPWHKMQSFDPMEKNITERANSLIDRFLRFQEGIIESATKKRWDKIESFDESMEINKLDLNPVSNELESREVEQYSLEAFKKQTKKPEKITLYSRNLPLGKIEKAKEIDSFEFDGDDDEDIVGRENRFVYFLEVVSGFFQLVYGGLAALFKSSSS